MTEDLSGLTIKGYQLSERIGAGGFGAVYTAEQSTVGRRVAVKIILPGYANQPDFIRRFESEARLIARLEHPYIVPLYDYWRDPSGAYLVMRWLRGGSLRDTLLERPFTAQAAGEILGQVASGLSLAHRSGVIHRDIKPSNILLDEEGNAYLTDFGIAQELERPEDDRQGERLVGTLDYLSPEQAKEETIGPQSDIYSLGITLYEVLTGQHPYPGHSSVERLFKHINDPLPEIEELGEGVNEVLRKATAKNPKQRYTDALEMAAAFRQAARLDGDGEDVSVVETLTPREQQILGLIVAGKTNRQIAQELFIELSTVKWYIRQIYSKLGVRSRVQAMVRARELQLVVSGPEYVKQAPKSTSVSLALQEAANPYKGLRAFEAADSRDFFGREALIERLIAKIDSAEGQAGPRGRFLAIVGPSGSGKSSLVQAGLIPAIWRGALPGSERWFVVEMMPGARPLDELEVALMRVAANQTERLREQLTRDDNGLLRVAALILPHDGSELVLIIDQFEELFTLVENEEERQFFLNLLRQAVSDPRSRVRVVTTLRADFYHRPLQYPEFGELVRRQMETVLPLSVEELERSIVRPAEQAGVQFEAGLAPTIIEDVRYQPGGLPLMQYALTELFDRREGRLLTRGAYEAIGGIAGALAGRAESLYQELDPEGQESVRQLFLQLTTVEQEADDGLTQPVTRRRVTRSELQTVAGDPELMDEVIDTYTVYRLLALDHDPSTRRPTVEVAHEAILVSWDRLRSWLEESRDDLRQRRRLGRLAADWQEAEQDPSFLLAGTQLDLFTNWAESTDLALTAMEKEFLAANVAAREAQLAEEAARQRRELETAQQLAEAEKKRAEQQSAAAQRLRRRAFLLVGALAIAAVLAAVAVFNGNRATQNAREAQDNLALAMTREAEAVVNANAAATQEALAQENADLATAREAEAQNVALVSGSQAALANYALDTAIALAWQAVELHPESALAQAQLSEAAYAPGTVRIFTGNDAVVNRVAISPDDETVLAGTVDGSLILWELATGDILWEQQAYPAEVNDISFSPDGKQVAATFDDRIMFWEAADGRLIREIESSALDQKIAFDPSGEQFVTIGKEEKSQLVFWDSASGEPLREFERGSEIEDIVYTADGSKLLLASTTGALTMLDAGTGESIYEVKTDLGSGAGALRFIIISPDGTKVLGSFSDSGLVTWDLASGEMLQFSRNQGGALALAYLAQEGTVLIGGQGLRTIDPQTGEVLRTNNSQGDAIFDITATSDGRYAIGTSLDGTVRMWDTQGGQVVRKYSGPQALLFEIALSPDAHSILVGLTDGTVTLYDVETGDVIQRLVDDQPIMSVTFSADGRHALTGGGYRLAEKVESGHIILWDLGTGEEIRRFEGHPYAVFDVEFSPDEQMIASAGNGAVAILWDAETGEEIRRFEEYWVDNLYPDISFWDIEFSPDGQQLFAAHADGTIIAWDVASGEEIQQLLGRNSGGKITFSSDGHQLVSGSVGSEVILWETDTGDIVRQFNNYSGALGYVKFSPDETLLLGGGENGTNSLWQVESGEEIRRYGGGFGFSPNFSPDGRHAVVGYHDGAVELWRIDRTLDELLTWTEANRYIPDLTCEQRELYSVEPLCEAAE